MRFDRQPLRNVSPERRLLHRAGLVVSGVGFLLFISFFFSIALAFFDDGPHFGPPAGLRTAPLRAIVGFFTMMAGGAMQGIARKGLAGSGLVLDPEQSRRDVEPWTRAAGGMVADAVDEARQELEEFRLPTLGEAPAADEAMPFDEKLRRLHALYQEGVLSRDEYERKKRQWLDAGDAAPGERGA